MKCKSREICVLCLGLLLYVTMGFGLHCGTTPPGLEAAVEPGSIEAGTQSERREIVQEPVPEERSSPEPEPRPEVEPWAEFEEPVVEQSPDLGPACERDLKRGKVCESQTCKNTGTWVCASDKQSLVCKVETSKEVCDGKDNDCNGKVDESVCPGPDEHWVHYFAYSGQNFFVSGLPKGGVFFLAGYTLANGGRASVEFSEKGYVKALLLGYGTKVHQIVVGPSAWLYSAGSYSLVSANEKAALEKDKLKWRISDPSAIKKNQKYDFRALQLMDNGELYATGTFKHPLTFGKVTLTPKSDQAYSNFVMRVDAKSGKILESYVHLDNNAGSYFIVADKQGRYAIFAQGDENFRYTFRGFDRKHKELWKRGGGSILGVDRQGHFYAVEGTQAGVRMWVKYDLENKALWKRPLLVEKQGFSTLSYDLTVDAKGNIYYLMRWTGEFEAGKQSFKTPKDVYHLAVAKFNKDGAFQKIAVAGEADIGSPEPTLTIDGLGHVYVAAKMSGKTKNFFSEKPRIIFSEKPGVRLYAIWRIPASYWK